MKVFEEGIVETTFEANDSAFVSDGGYQLHVVVRRKKSTFQVIVESYFSYVIRKYEKKVPVVFDGYPEFPTTKLQEQEQRATKILSHTILFNENTVCITQQSESILQATEEAVSHYVDNNDESTRNISVGLDGTWQGQE